MADFGLGDQARQVADSARAFHAALGRTTADQAVALDDLEQAARDWAVRAEAVQGFQAAEEEATAGGEEPGAAGPSAEDRLAAVAADLDVAEVLLAAGIAAEEIEADVDGRQILQTSVNRLEAGTAATAALSGATAGFAGPTETGGPTGDPHATFSGTLDGTVDGVVTGTLGVLKDAWTHLRDLAPDQVQQAITAFGDVLDAAPQIGRLVRLGLQALKRALLALFELLPQGLQERARSWAREWWGGQRDGAEQALVARLIAAQEAKQALDRVDIVALEAAVLEHAAKLLRTLGDRFARLARAYGRVLSALAAAVAVATLIAAVVTAVAAWVPVAAAAGYLAAAGSVILLARDYLDTGGFPARVEGVQDIVRALRPG